MSTAIETHVRAGEQNGSGLRLDADHLAPSELILPPDDISLGELAGELPADGIIPG